MAPCLLQIVSLFFVHVLSCFRHVQFRCDPMDCSSPGSSFHEISQARILELVACLSLENLSYAELKNSPLPPEVFQVLSFQHYPFLCRGFTNFKITLIQEIWILFGNMVHYMMYKQIIWIEHMLSVWYKARTGYPGGASGKEPAYQWRRP